MAQSDANLSQESNDTQPNLSQGLGEMQISAQNIGQALDILSAEAENLNDVQQQETALANVNLLRNLMRQTGVISTVSPERPTGATTRATVIGTQKGGGNGTAAKGMDVATRVQDLGFVDFTAGLINGTFDAVIGATIKQMEAYAKLVADVGKTLQQFQAANVSDAQIDAHLSNRYPAGVGGTSIKTDYIFTDTTDAATGVITTAEARRKAVADALSAETAGLGNPLNGVPSAVTVKELEVKTIRDAISEMLASNMMVHLRAMAREGMARIVITEGFINTKLTFKVDTTETHIKQEAQYRSSSFGASVSGYYTGKKWGVSGAVGYSRINVSAVNETNYDNTTMSAEMFGEVMIKFKTESFAPYEAPIATAANP